MKEAKVDILVVSLKIVNGPIVKTLLLWLLLFNLIILLCHSSLFDLLLKFLILFSVKLGLYVVFAFQMHE